MSEQELRNAIATADAAINREDFEQVMRFYAEDAVLVLQPGTVARGKAQIREAFDRIAEYFHHSLRVHQPEMQVLMAGATALVLARAELSAQLADGQPWQATRRSTYVFRQDPDAGWLCLIDNSYGTDLLEAPSHDTGNR